MELCRLLNLSPLDLDDLDDARLDRYTVLAYKRREWMRMRVQTVMENPKADATGLAAECLRQMLWYGFL